MKVWNVSNENIKQLYNSAVIDIKANSTMDLPDDVIVFLLGKKEIRGRGLVQLKEGDKKTNRYAEGRLNIYNWNKQIYGDYERHCEEREAQRLQPVKAHEAVLEAKKIIEDYEKWKSEGSQVAEALKETVGQTKVYACPHCVKEFNEKIAYFGHLRSHKEKKDVTVSPASNKSEGEG